MNRLVTVLLSAVLAACAAPEMRWHKSGADDVVLERDLDRCTQEASLQARHEQPPAVGLAALPGAPPVIGTDTQGRPVQAPRRPSQSDRFLAEHDLTRICMRGKGYEQVQAK